MSEELEIYMSTRLSQLRDFYVPKKKIDEAKQKMSKATSEIQIDNIVRTVLLTY